MAPTLPARASAAASTPTPPGACRPRCTASDPSTGGPNQWVGELTTADADYANGIKLNYTLIDADSYLWLQTMEDAVTGTLLSTFNKTSGPMLGWGTAIECNDDNGSACTGTISEQVWEDSVITLASADSTFDQTLGAGTGVVYTDMTTEDDGLTWTISKITIPAMTTGAAASAVSAAADTVSSTSVAASSSTAAPPASSSTTSVVEAAAPSSSSSTTIAAAPTSFASSALTTVPTKATSTAAAASSTGFGSKPFGTGYAQPSGFAHASGHAHGTGFAHASGHAHPTGHHHHGFGHHGHGHGTGRPFGTGRPYGTGFEERRFHPSGTGFSGFGWGFHPTGTGVCGAGQRGMCITTLVMGIMIVSGGAEMGG